MKPDLNTTIQYNNKQKQQFDCCFQFLNKKENGKNIFPLSYIVQILFLLKQKIML